jgi:hypothetical protein
MTIEGSVISDFGLLVSLVQCRRLRRASLYPIILSRA